jgi:hypothetical protein
MRDVRSQQTSFTAGEVAPTLKARVEVARYFAGASLLRNVLVVPQGGIRRRPGLRHCVVFGGGADGLRLIPFAFNVEQTYCIAIYAGALVVALPDGTVVHTSGGHPWTASQAAAINFCQSADTLLLFHPDLAPQRIRRAGGHTLWNRDAVPLTNIPTFDFGGGAEAVISGTRGWPECGTFHAGRLWMGGLRSRPSTALASKVGDFFNFDTGTGLDDEGINVTIDSDEVNAIHAIRSGRSLQLFTSGAEWAEVSTPPITPTNVTFQEQTRRGMKRFSATVEVDGASLFIQRGGAALRQFVYQEVEAAWRSDLVSLLAPHLIKDPVQLAVRKGAAADDADLVILVNADGTVSVLTTLRVQEIAAFTRMETADGLVKSAAALSSGEVFFAVLRDGTVRLETWNELHRLDASVRQVVGGGATTVSGLSHLNGKTVALYLDGAYLGTAVVASGAVTLPRSAVTAEVGLAVDVVARMLPFEPRSPTGPIIGKKARIAGITARVHETGVFRVQGKQVVHRVFTVTLDDPPPVVTADIELRGLVGWQERIEVEVSQPDPAPFHLLALSYDAVIET